MARKSNIQMIFDAAIADASSEILKKTIGAMGKDTTVHELVTAIKPTSFAASFHAMTLAELADAIGNAASTGPRRRGRPAKAKAGPRTRTGTKRSGKINTRTLEGRAELDAMIGSILQASPDGLRSEAINSQVPADTAQIRQSLNRMIAAGQVSKTGEKRATTYSWGGKAKAKATKGRSPKRKKATGKKAGARKKASKKAPARRKAAKKRRSTKKTATKTATSAAASA